MNPYSVHRTIIIYIKSIQPELWQPIKCLRMVHLGTLKQEFRMSKELPSTHGTAATFGIPDRSWYRYEQDFDTVLSPPSVSPPYFQLPPGTAGRLKKSHSQPSMNIGAITLTSNFREQRGRDMTSAVGSSQRQELVLTSALMPNQPGNKLCSSTFTDAVQETNSLAQRYETGPAYSSSKILSSFQKNFQVYGHELKPHGVSSLSAPPSPKPGEHLDNHHNVIAEVDGSAAREKERRLTKALEQKGACLEKVETSVAVQSEQHKKWGAEKLFEPQSQVELIHAEFSESSSAGGLRKETKPLTRQVIDWLSSPKSEVKINRKEFNALTPTSF